MATKIKKNTFSHLFSFLAEKMIKNAIQ